MRDPPTDRPQLELHAAPEGKSGNQASRQKATDARQRQDRYGRRVAVSGRRLGGRRGIGLLHRRSGRGWRGRR